MAPCSIGSGKEDSAPLKDEVNSAPVPLNSPKRARGAQSPSDNLPDELPYEPPDRRLRTFPTRPWGGTDEEVAEITSSYKSFIEYWAATEEWPKAFYQDSMEHLYAEKKPGNPSRKSSKASTATPRAPGPEGKESASFKVPSYHVLLETRGYSYMRSHEDGIRDECKNLCQQLLESKQPIPPRTIFGDDVFETTCNRLHGKNKERILKDLTQLIIPSAEPLATLGARHLDVVAESVNEAWDNCIKIKTTPLQPDYAVGFQRSAFSDDQLKKLQPFVGDLSDRSYFMATHYMYFPFMACQVKSGTGGLDEADDQNADSMNVALRGIVTLFRAVKREQELHQRHLGFSISHDQESVRIWGHYAVMEESKITFWRHPIRSYNFTEWNGLEQWTAYTFTRNVYDVWVPFFFKLICSAVDDLPLPQDIPSSDLQPEDANGVAEKGKETWSIDVGLPYKTPEEVWGVLRKYQIQAQKALDQQNGLRQMQVA